MKRWLTAACFSLALALPASAQEIPAGIKLPTDMRFQTSPGTVEYPHAKALLIQDTILFTARPDGTSEFEEHDVIKVLNDRGVQEHREVLRVYQSDFETIEVKRACTILPDGRVLEIPKQAIVDEPLFPDSKVYKNLRKFEIHYPGVRPNSIVEFHLVTKRKALPGNKWWAVTYVQNPDPMLESTFDVRVPNGATLRWNAPGLGSLNPEKTADGSWDRYFWRVKQLPPYQAEPLAPSSLTAMQRIEVSNFESWNELRGWFDKGWATATEPSEKITQQASSLYAADASPEARAQAILKYVSQKKILQVPTENLQPRPAQDVMGEDVLVPLDAAALTASLFQAAGLKAQPILAVELPSERLAGQLPRANRVSQVLLKVTAGSRVYWLDSEHLAELQDSPPSGYLGMGALLGDGDNIFQDLPGAQPDTNGHETRVEARVDREGRAEVLLSTTEYGKSGLIYREAGRELLASGKDKREQILERLFERIARNFSPRARVHDRFFSLGTKAGEPFDLSTTLSVPGYAMFEGDRGRMPLPIQPNEQIAGLVSNPGPRTQPVQFGHPIREEVRLHLIFPTGTKVLDLPATAQVDSPYGSFFATSRSEGNELWYYSRLTLDKTWVPVEKTVELMDFARKVLASQTTPIVFAQPARPAASASPRT